MLRKYWKLLFSVFFFVVIVPIGINESYKAETIYITMWEAPDVLGFYGTVLSAFVAVGVLAVTIAFTKKQLQRDAFLKAEKEKWDKIESLFAGVLDKINPIRPISKVLGSTDSKPVVAMGIMREYTLDCNMATDQLNAYLNTVDYSRLESLINSTINACKVFSNLYEESIEAYNTLSELQNRDTLKNALDTEVRCPGTVATNTLKLAQSIVDRIEGLSSADMIDRISQINDRIIKAYHEAYRPLLKEKGTTFEIISNETQKQAEDILCLWEK